MTSTRESEKTSGAVAACIQSTTRSQHELRQTKFIIVTGSSTFIANLSPHYKSTKLSYLCSYCYSNILLIHLVLCKLKCHNWIVKFLSSQILVCFSMSLCILCKLDCPYYNWVPKMNRFMGRNGSCLSDSFRGFISWWVVPLFSGLWWGSTSRRGYIRD